MVVSYNILNIIRFLKTKWMNGCLFVKTKERKCNNAYNKRQSCQNIKIILVILHYK